MKVTSLELKDVGGIPNLKLENINSQMNIICGENGVGKTNILDSIAYIFSEYANGGIIVKKGMESGAINLTTDDGEYSTAINSKNPVTNWLGISVNNSVDRSNLLYLKTNRGIDYQKLSNISSDKNINDSVKLNTNGVSKEDLKNWLIVRKGFSFENLTLTQKLNSELVSRCFSIINDEYSFSSAKTDFEVYVKTPSSNGNEMQFELLSSGFKSVIFILVGIIKELDIRFKDIIPAAEYDGIILIDEVELHLHPDWQSRICGVLKKIFPKAQFFITTHSPHVVQTAIQGEVIALERKENEVIQRDLPTSEYGYQGWTVEEILEDVMGMPDLRTRKYNDVKKRFDNALDSENKSEAQAAYDELDKMLHPHYPLRPVFRMQLDSLGE
ncbi:MAG: AAA family ATPase [Candidatus Acinetobacter avistercoris]|nr:AAA family ATPase [Candidatus Acinetobacter avistercoris]